MTAHHRVDEHPCNTATNEAAWQHACESCDRTRTKPFCLASPLALPQANNNSLLKKIVHASDCIDSLAFTPCHAFACMRNFMHVPQIEHEAILIDCSRNRHLSISFATIASGRRQAPLILTAACASISCIYRQRYQWWMHKNGGCVLVPCTSSWI